MYKEIKTLGDLQAAFENIPEAQKDAWVDSFWTVYSHGMTKDRKLLAKF